MVRGSGQRRNTIATVARVTHCKKVQITIIIHKLMFYVIDRNTNGRYSIRTVTVVPTTLLMVVKSRTRRGTCHRGSRIRLQKQNPAMLGETEEN